MRLGRKALESIRMHVDQEQLDPHIGLRFQRRWRTQMQPSIEPIVIRGAPLAPQETQLLLRQAWNQLGLDPGKRGHLRLIRKLSLADLTTLLHGQRSVWTVLGLDPTNGRDMKMLGQMSSADLSSLIRGPLSTAS